MGLDSPDPYVLWERADKSRERWENPDERA